MVLIRPAVAQGHLHPPGANRPPVARDPLDPVDPARAKENSFHGRFVAARNPRSACPAARSVRIAQPDDGCLEPR
jgi:hypothetical protein